MVLQVQGNDQLQVFHRGAVPRVQERKRRDLLRSTSVALVAQQSREILPKTMAPDDPLVGAIGTILDDDVSLRPLAAERIT